MSNHILIIEDDRDLAEALEDILQVDAYTVTVMHTGRDGLRAALDLHPDLIILDIKMPDMDGYEVFAKLRSDSWGNSANVLVLTASESLENISKNINLPLDNVLFKPEVSVTELRETIKGLLT